MKSGVTPGGGFIAGPSSNAPCSAGVSDAKDACITNASVFLWTLLWRGARSKKARKHHIFTSGSADKEATCRRVLVQLRGLSHVEVGNPYFTHL
jgi:hypothetical protein